MLQGYPKAKKEDPTRPSNDWKSFKGEPGRPRPSGGPTDDNLTPIVELKKVQMVDLQNELTGSEESIYWRVISIEQKLTVKERDADNGLQKARKTFISVSCSFLT